MAPLGAKIESQSLVMTSRAVKLGFLLLFFLPALAHTYRIPVKRDYDPDERYYMNGKIRCLRCGPGTYVLNQCTNPDTLGICAPCHPGNTYSEHLTGLSYCLACSTCRSDQEQESECTVARNTRCRCKNGTFCPPDEDCERCHTCRTRSSCPPDQEIQTQCNSTSDAQCGPPEAGFNLLLAILLPVLAFIILLAVLGVWCYCKKKNAASKCIPKITSLRFKCYEVPEANIPFLRSKLQFKESVTENEKNDAINKTLMIFLDMVPTKVFERFVRRLGLIDNDIDRAKFDNQGTENQHYAMLSQLHLNDRFDVNIWLETLHGINMKKVAQDIAEKLTRDGLFERSTHR